MSSEAKRRATYQDVLEAPENLVAEVIDGVLYTQPRPRARHSIAASRLGADLGRSDEQGRPGPSGWVVLDEPELHLGPEPDIVVPDLAAWRRERFPSIDDDPPYFTVAPDWLCEVLSPSTARRDRLLKLPLYAREGVRWAWLIDPPERLIEVYRLDGETWRLVRTLGDESTAAIEPFDEVDVRLEWLWEV